MIVLTKLHKTLYGVLIGGLLLVVMGCGGAKQAAPIQTAESLYQEALESFNDEDYFEAQRLFDLLKMRFPASQYNDDAHFYLAEINFKRREFILAAFNYNNLRKTFPGSEFAKTALFKVADSYYHLSPDSYRDQEHTRMAIKSFRDFIKTYPNDTLVDVSKKKIQELRDRLAEHEFQTAELYIKLESPRSSLIYYDAVLNDYADTRFYEPAYIGKIRLLKRLKKYEDAKESIRSYLRLFPSGEFVKEARAVEKDIASLQTGK